MRFEQTNLKKDKAKARNQALDDMFDQQPVIESISPKTHGYSTAKLSQLIPDPTNTRIGQTELIEKLPDIKKALLKEVSWPGLLPHYSEMKNKIALSPEAINLYNHCASLANTYKNGHANEAITVFPSEKPNGDHVIFFGNRRFIAYNLLEPFTHITSVDVIVNRVITDPLSSDAHIYRITENNSKVENSLGEILRSLNFVISALKREGTEINVSQISRDTGIERTKCGRLLKIVESNVSESTLVWLHNNDIKDITSLSMIFEQPSEKWDPLLDQLIKKGPTEFRENMRETKDVKKPKPDVKNHGSSLILNLIKDQKPEWFSDSIDQPAKQLSDLIKKLSLEG